jgi:hypothetical protein
MYSYTIYDGDGALLERTEQEEPVDIEALCKKWELGFWRHTHRVEKFKMTTYWCFRGRIHVKYIEEES